MIKIRRPTIRGGDQAISLELIKGRLVGQIKDTNYPLEAMHNSI